MIEIIKAVVLGIVEGITEFLPISSTGHVILVDRFLHLAGSRGFVTSFEVVIQLGAILAVVIIYFRDLWPFQQREKASQVWRTWLLVVVGVIPAFVVGFLFDDWIEQHLFHPLVVSIALIGYGIVLILVERWGEKHFDHRTPLELLSVRQAFLIGLFQCLALIPGTSRSLATILGGLALGLSRESAARFSFFMAIPVMVGASGLKLVKNAGGFSANEVVVLGVGFVVSFVVAWVAVRTLIRYIQRHDFQVFGYYRIVLGAVVLILLQKGLL